MAVSANKPDTLISANLSPVVVYSGVIRDATYTTVGQDAKSALFGLKPTENCWRNPMKEDPSKGFSAFYAETKFGEQAAQYSTLWPSLYSGRMASFVQVLLGAGKAVPYGYKWAKCHGVVMDTNGKPWVVEVSTSRGVWAMPLRTTKIPERARAKQPVLAKCHELFGGLPNTKGFPTDANFASLVGSGDILQLISPQNFTEITDKSPFSNLLGWSFKPTGAEAHNTCFALVGDQLHAYLYRLSFSLAVSPNRQLGDPVGVGTATLTMVEDGPYIRRPGENVPFGFVQEGGGVYAVPPSIVGDSNTADDYAERTFPIYVTYTDGQLDVVRVVSTALWGRATLQAATEFVPQHESLVEYRGTSQNQKNRKAVVTCAADTTDVCGADMFYGSTLRSFVWDGWSYAGDYRRVTLHSISTSGRYSTAASRTFCTCRGSRDGYLLYRSQFTIQTTTGSSLGDYGDSPLSLTRLEPTGHIDNTTWPPEGRTGTVTDIYSAVAVDTNIPNANLIFGVPMRRAAVGLSSWSQTVTYHHGNVVGSTPGLPDWFPSAPPTAPSVVNQNTEYVDHLCVFVLPSGVQIPMSDFDYQNPAHRATLESPSSFGNNAPKLYRSCMGDSTQVSCSYLPGEMAKTRYVGSLAEGLPSGYTFVSFVGLADPG